MDVLGQWAVDHFKAEWASVTGAPVIFLAAIALCGVAAWLLARAQFSERIEAKSTQAETKDAHIAFLEGQIADYREKLSGASPDQAAHQIAALRDELTTARTEIAMIVEWYRHSTTDRRLTDVQKVTISHAVALIPDDHKNKITVSCIREPEPQQFAIDLLESLKGGGLCGSQPIPWDMAISSPDEVGLLIVVNDEKNPPDYASALMEALQKANVAAKFDTFDDFGGERCSLMVSFKPGLPIAAVSLTPIASKH